MLVSLPRGVNPQQMRTRRDDATENGVNWPTKVAEKRTPRVLVVNESQRFKEKGRYSKTLVSPKTIFFLIKENTVRCRKHVHLDQRLQPTDNKN